MERCATQMGLSVSLIDVNIGVGRTFRLREVVPSDEKDDRSARTFNIPLRHNSVGLCTSAQVMVVSDDAS